MELKEMSAQRVAKTHAESVFEPARLFALASKRLDMACLEFQRATQDGPGTTDVERLRDDMRLAEAACDHFKARLLREFEELPF